MSEENELLNKASKQEPLTCGFCGAELEWIDCWICGGDGVIDETEYDPLEGDKFARCNECNGDGGYLECPDLPHITPDTVPNITSALASMQ